MANSELTREQCEEAYEALQLMGTKNAAARYLEIPPGTFRNRISRGKELYQLSLEKPSPEGLELPNFPDEDIPVEEELEQAAKRFKLRQASHDAHTWFKVKVKEKKPIGVLWVGDPHIDDNGCNLPVLMEHCRICSETEGLYGANIGDTTNNWVGRLMSKYANQDASVKTARRRAEWLMMESGVKWLIWILGNHDNWNDGAEIMAQMAKRHGTQKLVCHDWEVRFKICFPNGVEFKVNAAHDFKGHSQWNPLHGPMKEGQMGEDAHLFVCGHKHNWAAFQWENAKKGIQQTFIRTRGYKYLDDYARHGGFAEQQRGASILTIFNPSKEPDSGGVTFYEDVAEGAEYLSHLRSK